MDKKLIQVLRKKIPQDMAEAIIGVQPMQGPVGQIFQLRKIQKTVWCKWETRFTWLPKKSIYGKIVWGKVQYRHEMNAWGKVPLISGVKQWATKKEVFESRLRGDREQVVEDEKYRRKTANA